ncbi:IclR family transcriptional regulator [Haloferax sp. AB510]|uniref:IclR family transcriptional regulator n=1 Tax=Haloferax sp. AB510 TaxID=2934172 RepID=UPI00209C2494|nr:IclR family transcriptional regulator [Haloferax sp. AB510]MCO8267147.1 IclR family transcriptional regulator [Haloferax sp. AB510]
MKNASGKPVNAIQTTMAILKTLEDMGRAGVTEITNEVPASKTTVYNHLTTLRQAGYVVKGDRDQYQIGLRFLETARAAKRRYPIRDVVEKELENLADQTGEIAHFGVAENGLAYNLTAKYGGKAVQTPFYEGYRTPMHVTAAGKAILAARTDEEVETYIDEYGLQPQTENSITNRDDLLEEIRSVREQGVAFNREENILGLVGVAVALTGTGDNVAGALCILGPASRMSQSELQEEYPELLKRSANIIELNSTEI